VARRANPVEAKVLAATGGALGGSAVSSFALWFLGARVWHVGYAAGKASEAIAAVPAPVSGLVFAGLATLGTYVAGYRAPHTSRTPKA